MTYCRFSFSIQIKSLLHHVCPISERPFTFFHSCPYFLPFFNFPNNHSRLQAAKSEHFRGKSESDILPSSRYFEDIIPFLVTIKFLHFFVRLAHQKDRGQADTKWSLLSKQGLRVSVVFDQEEAMVLSLRYLAISLAFV